MRSIIYHINYTLKLFQHYEPEQNRIPTSMKESQRIHKYLDRYKIESNIIFRFCFHLFFIYHIFKTLIVIFFQEGID